MNSPGFDRPRTGTECFKGFLILMTSSSKEEEAARWKVSIRSFHMTDDSTGGDRDNGAMRQAQRVHCLRSRHIRCESSASRAAIHWFSDSRRIQRLDAAPSSAHVQEYGVELTAMSKVQDPRAGYACYLFRLVSRYPLGVPLHGSGKITVLATDEALPIFDYELLECIVKRIQIPGGEEREQVSIEISKDVAEVERGRIC